MKASSRALALFRRAAVFLGLTVAVFVFGLFAGSTRAAPSSWVAVDLGTLGGSTSYATAVNEAGMVVGQSYTADNENHAFAWTEATGMVDLGTLGGSYSSATAVNEAGMVVGSSHMAGNSEWHAFAWTEATGMVDLGTLGGSSSSATAVNDAGQVVGSGRTAGTYPHATLWQPADSAEQLASLAAAVDGVGPGKSLADKVMEIQGYLAADETATACMMLDAFINEVEAQTGKKITSEQAASFTAQADNIKATLGCQTDR